MSKKAILRVDTCGRCPFIRHDRNKDVFGYYCSYSHVWLPNELNIIENIYESCQLDEMIVRNIFEGSKIN